MFLANLNLFLQLPNKVMEVFTRERELHKTVLKTLKQMQQKITGSHRTERRNTERAYDKPDH